MTEVPTLFLICIHSCKNSGIPLKEPLICQDVEWRMIESLEKENKSYYESLSGFRENHKTAGFTRVLESLVAKRSGVGVEPFIETWMKDSWIMSECRLTFMKDHRERENDFGWRWMQKVPELDIFIVPYSS